MSRDALTTFFEAFYGHFNKSLPVCRLMPIIILLPLKSRQAAGIECLGNAGQHQTNLSL